MIKKTKNFVKKQIQILLKKKKFEFKIQNELIILKIIKILSKKSIVIFTQFLSLNAENDWIYYLNMLDFKYDVIFLSKKNILKIFDKNITSYLKNFNNIICINNLFEIKTINNDLKKKNILILGYYFNNIFFNKKDFFIEKIKKKNIYLKLKKWTNNIQIFLTKMILLLSFLNKKMLFLLKR